MRKLASPIVIVGIAFLFSPGYVIPQIYKCSDETGKTVFSDKKCGDKLELVKIKKDKPSQSPASIPFYCPSGIIAVINNLHYPTLNDITKAVRLAEADLTSLHYRKAIKRVDPEDVLPDRVSKIRAEAYPASEVPGFSNGVVVNVKICK
jgi:hypothetical protein